MSWKNSLLVIWKLLGLFVETLNAGHKYSLLNRENLKQSIQLQLSQTQKLFSQLSSAILKSRLNFQHFPKKDDPHSWCISEITDSKKRLNKCLRSLVSEDPSRSNMVRWTKDCWYMNGITIFIDHCEGSWVGKDLS